MDISRLGRARVRTRRRRWHACCFLEGHELEATVTHKNLFDTLRSLLPRANALNEELAPAYRLSNEGALAQLAATGCFGRTFYAAPETQLAEVLSLAVNVDARFVARTALFARERGHMKDMPALLCAYLAAYEPALFDEVFDVVIDNGKMLSTFAQILRSGAVGRRSFGTRIKRKVQAWLDARTDEQLVRASAGMTPSLADIVKMVHPRPLTASRRALYGWLLDRPYDAAALPPLVAEYERFRTEGVRDRFAAVPDVPFQMLASLPLHPEHWAQIADKASWQMTRMNLNTFSRHGVWSDRRLTAKIAARLSSAELVKKARVFPYQLLAAWAMSTTAPASIRAALEQAMEHALDNVPSFEGRVAVCPDVSGSMQSPVTGRRGSSTTAVRCVDVAALVASAVLRKNANAVVLPFEHRVVDVRLSRAERVLENAARLAKVGGGGTACSAPLAKLVADGTRVDVVLLVSDNESWRDTRGDGVTETMRQWTLLKRKNPRARLVCLDLQPYTTVQAVERQDILHVGGFSDQVFDVVAAFSRGELSDGWTELIERVPLSREERAA